MNIIHFFKQCSFLLFPPYCSICAKILPLELWGESVCDSCSKQIPFFSNTSCYRCGSTLSMGELCPLCKTFALAFSKGFAVFPYAKIRTSIHHFKFFHEKHLAITFASFMGQFLLEHHASLLQEIDYIHAVPMHPIKQKKRGYNQVEELCKHLSPIIKVPHRTDILIRVKNNQAQSTVSSADRAKNISGAFSCFPCENHTILLVDDVFTTGSTLHECSKVLLRYGGAKDVIVLTLASA